MRETDKTVNEILKTVYSEQILQQLRWDPISEMFYISQTITPVLLACTLGFRDQPELYHELTEEDYNPVTTFRVKK